jgi:hypothetical protein
MKIIVSIMLLISIVGCSPHSRSAWSKQDTWYHPPTEWGAGPYNLPQVPYYEVPAEQQAMAESLLEASPAIELSDIQVQKLLGESSNKPKLVSYFLVRSVVLYESTGKYAVYLGKNELWVTHNCLGKTPPPMKRRSLVVPLEEQPHTIYVICGMDE